MTLLFFAVQILIGIAFAPALALWGILALARPRLGEGALERLGLWAKTPERPIWIHGASVGEVRAVLPLLRALLDLGAPLVVTTTTVTGRAEARAALGAKGAARLLPVDFLPCLGHVFSRVRPTALVIAETELWPGLLWTARFYNVPVYLVTARISPKSFPRYMRFRPLVAWMLGFFRGIEAQTEDDAERFMRLGASPEKVRVGGNMKFDLAPPDSADAAAASLRRTHAGGWRVLVAGSLHPQEARVVFEGARAVRQKGIHLGLVAAPRHLERMPEILSDLAGAGGAAVLYSDMASPREAAFLEAFRAGKTVVVDSYGILGRLYGGADVSFVGGSLVPVGGHNLLEPLRWGVPVLFGPHMQSAQQVRDEVLTRRLGRMVQDAGDFAETVAGYLENAELRQRVQREAEAFFAQNHGATRRMLDALRACGALDRRSSP